jgi:hypothetical protein
MDDDPARGGLERPVDDRAVKVQVRIERRAAAVDEGHRAEPGGATCARAVGAQAGLPRAQEEPQGSTLPVCIAFQEVARTLGHRQDPLAQGQLRQDVIDQMRCCLHHAPRVARWTNVAPLAPERDQDIVPARVAAGASEANSACYPAPACPSSHSFRLSYVARSCGSKRGEHGERRLGRRVIGAGAAGMMCAAQAGQRGRRVLLVEHYPIVGEKIRISGGGRCNFTNLHAGPANYLSQNPDFCRSALARYTPAHFVRLVERHGIAWHEKKLGQLFCDHSALDIIAMLRAECERGRVQWRIPCAVAGVTREGNGFVVATALGSVRCASLVIATGGLTVLKPNFNSADPPPGSTHDHALRALLGKLRSLGADPPTIGDRSGMGDTREVMERKGTFSLAKAFGAEVVVFDELGADDWMLIKPADSHWQNGSRCRAGCFGRAASCRLAASRRIATAATLRCRSRIPWAWRRSASPAVHTTGDPPRADFAGKIRAILDGAPAALGRTGNARFPS